MIQNQKQKRGLLVLSSSESIYPQHSKVDNNSKANCTIWPNVELVEDFFISKFNQDSIKMESLCLDQGKIYWAQKYPAQVIKGEMYNVAKFRTHIKIYACPDYQQI